MFRKKYTKPLDTDIDVRTTDNLALVLEVADSLKDSGNDPTSQQVAVKKVLPLMEDIYARFSNIKKLKDAYETIKGITLYPNQEIRLTILSFYYAGKDALLKDIKRKTVVPVQCDCENCKVKDKE